jgi:hypothetical protein
LFHGFQIRDRQIHPDLEDPMPRLRYFPLKFPPKHADISNKDRYVFFGEVAMDGISAVNQSTQALGDLLQMITTKQTDMAEKMVKVTTEMALASQPGLGQAIDMVA